MYLFLAALVSGVFLSYYHISLTAILFVTLSISVGLFLFGLLRKLSGHNVRIIGISILALFFVCLGAMRMSGVIDTGSNEILLFDNQYHAVSGQVISLPEDRETKTRVVLGHVMVADKPIASKVLVWLPNTEEVRVKDTVHAEGVFRIPESFETNTGRIFEYDSYLAKDDIYLEMLDPQEVTIISHESFSLLRMLESIKHFFLDRIEKVLPEPHSSLAGGILLGEKQSLGDFWQEQFRIVGLTHIVVLSGYNIAIVVGVILFLFSGLSLLWGSLFSIAGIVLFALLVGGGATVVRASIMASLLIVARYFHRPYQALRGLMLAGAIMVLINPRILIHDLSFQLSFLATLGIILYTPIFERWCQRIPAKLGLREIVVTTLSAQLFVFPWIAYTIGDFSLVSFVANVAVLPIVPLAMLFSFIAGLLPHMIIAVPAYVLLHYILFVTETLSGVPYASIVVPQMHFVVVLAVYVFLTLFSLRNKKPH